MTNQLLKDLLSFFRNVILHLKNFVFLLLICNITILVIFSLRRVYLEYYEVQDWRLSLPVYENYDWANQYFEDNERILSDFVPFIGFKDKSLISETINIDSKGVRFSRNQSDSAQVIFLGGSLMFGAGSDDFNTIPSLFAKYTKDSIGVKNLGSNGLSIFQNYIKLTQFFFDEQNPEIVISFDGGVEAIIQDRNYQFQISHLGAEIFQNAIEEKNSNRTAKYFLNLIEPLNKFLSKIKQKIIDKNNDIVESKYEQQLNEKELDRNAKVMVNSWEQMMVLCQDRKVDFFCFYSPILTESSKDFQTPLINRDVQRFPKTFQYNRIRLKNKVLELLKTKRYAALSEKFIDMSTLLDTRPNSFIDGIGHFSPAANELISKEIINSIFKIKSK